MEALKMIRIDRMAHDFLDSRYGTIHDMYRYHRLGMDNLSEEPDDG